MPEPSRAAVRRAERVLQKAGQGSNVAAASLPAAEAAAVWDFWLRMRKRGSTPNFRRRVGPRTTRCVHRRAT